jgi:putative addiction module CopG family antidote
MAYAFPPDLEKLVGERMASGEYESEDELLLHALHALEAVENAHEHLRQELAVRIERARSEVAVPFDLDALKLEARKKFANGR